MNAGDSIALGGAVVAGVAALIAIAQAITAKDQARIARDQAESARDSAESARRQAGAAEEQVAIMRTQLEADLAARDEAEGPEFAIENPIELWRGERHITATLVLRSGPPLSEVRIGLRGPDVRSIVSYVDEFPDVWVKDATWSDVSPVSTRKLIVWMEHEAIGPLHLTLDLNCTERDGQNRTWTRSCAAVAQPEPPDRSPFRRYLDDD